MSEDKTSKVIARANAEGGAAFPVSTALHWSPGMSLRDWFAGQALAGVMANSNIKPTETFETIANHAFAFADAMLAEREKTKPVEVKPGDDWTPHDGGPMPCDGNAMVDLRFRNGEEAPESSEAKIWGWQHTGFSHDIFAWRYHKEGA
jgi:hypothetical protein